MIQVELGPEVEAQVATVAQSRSVSTEEYLRGLVLAALPIPKKELSEESLESFFESMSEFGKDAPQLSEYALTRESWYEDDGKVNR